MSKYKIPFKNIWLQCHYEDCEGGDCSCDAFDAFDGVCWNDDRINDSDIEYINKADYDKLRTENEKLKGRFIEAMRLGKHNNPPTRTDKEE